MFLQVKIKKSKSKEKYPFFITIEKLHISSQGKTEEDAIDMLIDAIQTCLEFTFNKKILTIVYVCPIKKRLMMTSRIYEERHYLKWLHYIQQGQRKTNGH